LYLLATEISFKLYVFSFFRQRYVCIAVGVNTRLLIVFYK
jgi:hypothetical protein